MSNDRVKLGEIPPNFSLEDTHGETVTLADFKGEKHVFLVFNRGFF